MAEMGVRADSYGENAIRRLNADIAWRLRTALFELFGKKSHGRLFILPALVRWTEKLLLHQLFT